MTCDRIMTAYRNSTSCSESTVKFKKECVGKSFMTVLQSNCSYPGRLMPFGQAK